MSSNVQVAIRVRPLIEQELQQRQNFCAYISGNTVQLRESLNTDFDDYNIYPTYYFSYDNVFGPNSTYEEVYNVCRGTVDAFTEGINGCIMAYGYTSSGKSYTINNAGYGIIPFTLRQIFERLSTMDSQYYLTLSYLYIYNENLYDLLGSSLKLQIREKNGEIFVENLMRFAIQTEQEAIQLFEIGNQARKTAETKMNYQSSRSHAVYTLYLYYQRDSRMLMSKLSILDLAGSEKAQTTYKERLRETKTINTSLTILSNVLNALLLQQTNPRQFIPYRDSKLTRLLQDSLGRNCKTTILVMISPASVNFSESVNSLKFGDRAKYIKENAIVNEIEGDQGKILRYRREIDELKAEIARIKLSHGDGDVEAFEKDKNTRGKTIYSADYNGRGLSGSQTNENELLASLSRLEQQKCQILNYQSELNELRAISVDQKNIMIVLSYRMQEIEGSYTDLSTEIEQIYRRIELLLNGTNVRKEFLRYNNCMDGDELSAQFIAKYSLESYIYYQKQLISSQIEPNLVLAEFYLDETLNQPLEGKSPVLPDMELNYNAAGYNYSGARYKAMQCTAELNYDYKQEEMNQLSAEYEQQVAKLKSQLQNAQAASEQVQDKLEHLVDQMTADVAMEQREDGFCAYRMSECARERALMLQIFREKVQRKVDGLKESDCDGLKQYLLRVAEAVEFGQLFGSLKQLFNAE